MMISNYAASQYNLEIEILEVKNNKGNIMLQLFDENHNLVSQEKGFIKDNKSIIKINNLAPGKYAVRYFHDENLNGILETNRIGKPTEGYGFSNDAYGTFGPKSFDKWLFEIKEDRKIALKTKY
jgi:uncharacterized protein (DUF2141 family)